MPLAHASLSIADLSQRRAVRWADAGSQRSTAALALPNHRGGGSVGSSYSRGEPPLVKRQRPLPSCLAAGTDDLVRRRRPGGGSSLPQVPNGGTLPGQEVPAAGAPRGAAEVQALQSALLIALIRLVLAKTLGPCCQEAGKTATSGRAAAASSTPASSSAAPVPLLSDRTHAARAVAALRLFFCDFLLKARHEGYARELGLVTGSSAAAPAASNNAPTSSLGSGGSKPTPASVESAARTLKRLLHPDKCPDVRAPEYFQLAGWPSNISQLRSPFGD